MEQRWLSDGGASSAELSQCLETAHGWRHRGTCPGLAAGPLQRHRGDQRGLRAAGSTPALPGSRRELRLGLGHGWTPQPESHQVITSPRKMEPGSSPHSSAAGVCGDAGHGKWGFPITELGQWESAARHQQPAQPGQGKACCYLNGIAGKEIQGLWGSVQ